jgi:Zn-dependent protease
MLTPRESVYLCHLGAIPLYAHWTALFMVLMSWNWSDGDMSRFAIYLFVLVTGILLHELGHGLMARALGAFGITITLWAFGGLCQSSRDPRPTRELLIVAAGPAVSLLLAGLGWVVGSVLYTHAPEIMMRTPLLAVFIDVWIWINLIMGIFNLLPIYPLDGGQLVYNTVWGVTGREGTARAITWPVAVVTGIAVLAASLHFLHNGRISASFLWTLFLVLFLLWQAYAYLRR